MIQITPEYLLQVRDVYESNQNRAKAMQAGETDPITLTYLHDQEKKAMGMKEAIEGLYLDLTGHFPELH